MVPAEYDITIYRGATFLLPMSYTDNTGAVDFEATYSGARMQIRPSALNVPDELEPPDDPIFDLSTTSGHIILSTTTLTIALSAEETAALSATSGVYDLELYVDGTTEVVDKFLYGKVIIIGEVTIPIVVAL